MKKIFGLFLCLIFAVCQSQEKKVSNEKKCQAVLTPSETLQWEYLNFMKDSVFYKSQFANFARIKNGVLFYRWQEGSGSNNFFTVDFDENFNASIRTKEFVKKVDFSTADKKKMEFISEILEKESYYQRCLKDHGHSTLYILIVRCNNEVKAQYYSPKTNLYEIETSDTNINLIKEIFSIMDRNYYKSITLKKTMKKCKDS
ncbi:MAG: hypothetical protein RSD71_18215 [Flavobacterium sp.]|uniref:hypothetical protein n=1 Tax=Flavobacterium sp. TaxID=239 RepID=UPI002FCCA97D